MLDYQPAKFFRRQIIRRKFVRREEPDLAPVFAPLPESLQQRCIASPGLLAQVIVSKYCDHLPLYAAPGIKRPMPGGGLCRVKRSSSSECFLLSPA
jgi:transposase